jgi:RNA polymerase sigma-70 factor, ECF subfamily
MEADELQRRAESSETYTAFYGRIWAYAARRVGEQAAADVTAEAFLVACRRFDDLPPDPLPWLYGVARHLVLRHRAAQVRDQALRSALESEGIAAQAAESDDRRLWDAWAELNETDREVLALVAWEQLRVRDAAVVIGCSPSVFSVRLHRARRRLEHLLTLTVTPAPKSNSHISEAS